METPIYKLRMDRTSVGGLALGLKSVICRNAPRRYRHGYRKDRRRASEEERAKKAELSGKSAIRHPHVRRLWRLTLGRRSQKGMLPWDRLTPIFDRWIPVPRVLHPYPTERFLATHPRWEPYA
jgi:hypothetical protein